MNSPKPSESGPLPAALFTLLARDERKDADARRWLPRSEGGAPPLTGDATRLPRDAGPRGTHLGGGGSGCTSRVAAACRPAARYQQEI